MNCSLRSSGEEASARSPYPGSFPPRVALHSFSSSSHAQFLGVFPADKALYRWGLLFPAHHSPAVKHSQATVPTSSSIKTSQRSREGQSTRPWFSSRAYWSCWFTAHRKTSLQRENGGSCAPCETGSFLSFRKRSFTACPYVQAEIPKGQTLSSMACGNAPS